MKNSKWVIFIGCLIVFNLFVWREIIFNSPDKKTGIYFFDVGQGDSKIAILPGNVKILIDGGPNKKILEKLSEVISPTDRYIDLVILSHPHIDHFGGLIDVVKRYQIGIFVLTGAYSDSSAFKELLKTLKEKNIKTITFAEKDKITYQNNEIKTLFPPNGFKTKDLNDASLILDFKNEFARILFTGDLGTKGEDYILKKYDLKSDIIKIPHHGSKASFNEEFLKAVNPKISVIEVGKNSYGHPAPVILEILKEVKSQIFRTDKNGTIKIILDNYKLNVFAK
ncbi:MAG: MBL fold metallo-hydrolase [Patescibacteria group bacterium]|nr:MBL fold metallo-hydrolase [Patescibacteria group bacterium]